MSKRSSMNAGLIDKREEKVKNNVEYSAPGSLINLEHSRKEAGEACGTEDQGQGQEWGQGEKKKG